MESESGNKITYKSDISYQAVRMCALPKTFYVKNLLNVKVVTTQLVKHIKIHNMESGLSLTLTWAAFLVHVRICRRSRVVGIARYWCTRRSWQ